MKCLLLCSSINLYDYYSATTTRKITQLDIKTAFLNAEVQENIYMQAPEGMNINNNEVLKLNKALYGIKQAPREWNININNYLISISFIPCKKDSCIYIKTSKTNNIIMLGLFVDDIMISYEKKDEYEIEIVKKKLQKKYELPMKEKYIIY